MNYPGGRPYRPKSTVLPEAITKSVIYANRGMQLESLVEYMNEVYERKQRAAIEKIPTAVKVLKAEGNKIKSAVYIKHGTVDYTGTYLGRALWFDAKSTQSLTSFPLSNLHDEQMLRLSAHRKNNAICFLLVQFVKLQRTFLLPYEVLESSWNQRHTGIRGSNSISLATFEKEAFEVSKSTYGPLDYLSSVDTYIMQYQRRQ